MTKNKNFAGRGRALSLYEAAKLQEIEGNPLTEQDIEMFQMFEREGWDQERRTAYVLDQIRKSSEPRAAE